MPMLDRHWLWVTAAKLRELGVIRGKIATIFHGIDISSRKCSTTTLPNINNCFAVAMDATNKRSVGLNGMGCPVEKIAVSRWALTLLVLTRPVKCLTPLEIICRTLNREKRPDYAIQACRQLKTGRGISLSAPPASARGNDAVLIEQYQLEDVVRGLLNRATKVKAMLTTRMLSVAIGNGADGDMEGIPVALMEAMASAFRRF